MINLYLFATNNNSVISENDLKNIVRQSFHLNNENNINNVLLFQTIDSYLKLIINQRNYLFFDPSIKKYSISGDTIDLGSTLYEIHNIESELKLDDFSDLINRIYLTVYDWKKQIDSDSNNFELVLKNIYSDKFKIVQFRQIISFFNNNFIKVTRIFFEIDDQTGVFLSDYIELKNLNLPENSLITKIDDFFNTIDDRLTSLGKLNFEFSKILITNERMISKSKEIINEILDLLNIEKSDNIYKSDIKILLIQLDKFFSILNTSISETNRSRLTNLIQLVRLFKNLILNERILNEFFIIWKDGIKNNLNNNYSIFNEYFENKLSINSIGYFQNDLENLKLDTLQDAILNVNLENEIISDFTQMNKLKALNSIRIIKKKQKLQEQIKNNICKKIDNLKNNSEIDLIELILIEEKNINEILSFEGIFKVFSSVITYIGSKNQKYNIKRKYYKLIERENLLYKIKTVVFEYVNMN